MRDRLIELIKQGEDNTPCEKYPNCDCTNKKCRDCEREGIADYLIANGVIVPPCKVGDTIWVYDSFMWGLIPCLVDKPYHCYCGDEGGCTFVTTFTNDDFGKTVFLTKEEAKVKLKELSDNA